MYDWAPHKEELRRMYLDEDKTLGDLQKHVKENYGFEPSKRAFEFQLRRWGHIKHARLRRPEQVEERMKALWEQSLSRREIIRTLHQEGFQCSEGQLARLRMKNGWMFRGGNGYTDKEGPRLKSRRKRSKVTEEQDLSDEQTPGGIDQQSISRDDVVRQMGALITGGCPNVQPPAISPSVLETPQRVVRLQEMQAHSDQLLATRKRQRRIKGYAGMGPDPPGPPRFPSETTLDESKAFLHLSNATYQEMRTLFQSICEESGVIRKAATAPEQWTAVKDRLVNEHAHLQREFYGPWNGVPPEQKQLALDAICMSVTKLMRTAGKTITIAEAKRILDLNPNDARTVRNHFYQMLRQDQFVSKHECGEEHWSALKAQWEAENPIVQQRLGDGRDEHKSKAIDRLAKDVMKRYRDDLIKANPSMKGSRTHGPGPGPVYKGSAKDPVTDDDDINGGAAMSTHHRAPRASGQARQARRQRDESESEDSDELPTAIPLPAMSPYEQFASGAMRREQSPRLARSQKQPKQSRAQPTPPLPVQPVQEQTNGAHARSTPPHEPREVQYQAQEPTATGVEPTFLQSHQTNAQGGTRSEPVPPNNSSNAPIAAMFRLHPSCPLYAHSSKTMWLYMLSTRTLSEVVEKALSQHSGVAGRSVHVRSVEGVLTDAQGQEASFSIQNDAELEAYFGWMQGGRCIFIVWLESLVV